MYNIILIILFKILYSFSYSVVPQIIDNFSDVEDSFYYTKKGYKNHYHNQFYDNKNNLINVTRVFSTVKKPENFHQFTLTKNNLHYESSRSNYTKHTLNSNYTDYLFEKPADLTSISLLKFNFSNISKAFVGFVRFESKTGASGHIETEFTPENLNPIIDLSNKIRWGKGDDEENLSQIFSMSGEFNSGCRSGLEFDLSSIELDAVPEPSSIFGSIFGIITLIRKRKQKL